MVVRVWWSLISILCLGGAVVLAFSSDDRIGGNSIIGIIVSLTIGGLIVQGLLKLKAVSYSDSVMKLGGDELSLNDVKSVEFVKFFWVHRVVYFNSEKRSCSAYTVINPVKNNLDDFVSKIT